MAPGTWRGFGIVVAIILGGWGLLMAPIMLFAAFFDSSSIDGGSGYRPTHTRPRPSEPRPKPVLLQSISVPELRGAGAARAQALLLAAGFNSEFRDAAGTTPTVAAAPDRWVVCDANPEPGKQALRGTVVTLIVAVGGCA